MSSTSRPTSSSPEARPSSGTSLVTSQGPTQRAMRPSQVQTTYQHSAPSGAIPVSAVSASTVASTSHQSSPMLTPENTVFTRNSSLQASPDPFRDHDVEMFPPPPPLHLGDPLIASKYPITSPIQDPPPEPSVPGNIMRRFSNRATKFARARRQSSAASNSREVSLGPGIMRRRSDSTNTAPAEPTFHTDCSDEDELNDLVVGTDRLLRDPRDQGFRSYASSVAGSSVTDIHGGPVLPLAVIKGTELYKISKNKQKRMLFTIESSTGRIIWDKGRSLKSLCVDDVKDIRIGSDIRQYRIDFGLPESVEGRFFTISYAVPDTSRSKLMHLVAEEEETFANWITALDLISKHRELHMASLMAFDDSAIRSFWISKMAKQNESDLQSIDEEEIDFHGVEQVCRNMHIHMAQEELKTKFNIADVTKRRRLNYAEFQIFVREVKRRKDVEPIFRDVASSPTRGITWQDFERFLRDTQNEDVDGNLALWESRFIRYAQSPRPSDSPYAKPHIDSITMTEDGLSAYLVSQDNGHLATERADHGFDRPLNEYFISSSHNTYLIGRQFMDVSSIEGYITTLLRGCRSVEIDCWDGPNGLPIVKHGRSLTSSISFREVVNTVNKYAFAATRFPLWVSLEVHCCPAQQEIMAETMKEIFGSRLVTEPLDPSADKLPTPSELKERILIKVKSTYVGREQRDTSETIGRRRGNSLTSPFFKPIIPDSGNIPPQHLGSSPLLGPNQQHRRVAAVKRVDTINEGEIVKHEAFWSSTSESDTEGEAAEKPKTSKIIKTLGDLGVYCSGIKFTGFESADCKKSNHILSLSEGDFRKHSKAPVSKKALSRHNMRYLMRVYPNNTRVASDNFNPLMYWRKGVQMAALNWQTFDHGMQLNQAMFAGGTDRSGYVLKPESMRIFRHLPEGLPEEHRGKLERQNVAFSIAIISAQRLMRPANLPSNKTFDPYVEMEVFHANDKRDKNDSMADISVHTDTPPKVTTCVVKENGFDPEFNFSKAMNVTTRYPELIFIKFTVRLSTDGEKAVGGKAIANYTVKLSSLQQGYRTLPLLDSNGDQFLFSRLFCHIKVYPATSVFLPMADSAADSSVSKLKYLGRNVFSRSSNTKSSFEKSSVDGSYGKA
ncbi:phosphatidylinositol-specific phospholipase C [Xylariaceae sp. FL0255]|nr:phosphatidylinositol-specific phospholipase C [Xylariaceae sp. FL0255]